MVPGSVPGTRLIVFPGSDLRPNMSMMPESTILYAPCKGHNSQHSTASMAFLAKHPIHSHSQMMPPIYIGIFNDPINHA